MGGKGVSLPCNTKSHHPGPTGISSRRKQNKNVGGKEVQKAKRVCRGGKIYFTIEYGLTTERNVGKAARRGKKKGRRKKGEKSKEKMSTLFAIGRGRAIRAKDNRGRRER